MGQLRDWAKRRGDGTFDSSTGFRLPSGAVRSPDAAWIGSERLGTLGEEQRRGFWTVCPEIVIEIASDTDDWNDVCAKMDMYARNGVRYGIALDPRTRKTYQIGEAPDAFVLDIDAVIKA